MFLYSLLAITNASKKKLAGCVCLVYLAIKYSALSYIEKQSFFFSVLFSEITEEDNVVQEQLKCKYTDFIQCQDAFDFFFLKNSAKQPGTSQYFPL